MEIFDPKNSVFQIDAANALMIPFIPSSLLGSEQKLRAGRFIFLP